VEDQTSAVEMAKVLGIAFFNQRNVSAEGQKKPSSTISRTTTSLPKPNWEMRFPMARSRNVSIESIFLKEMKVRKNDVGRSIAQYYNSDYVLLTAITPFRRSAGKAEAHLSQEQPVGSPREAGWEGQDPHRQSTRSTGSTASSLCFLQKATSSPSGSARTFSSSWTIFTGRRACRPRVH